MNAPFPNRFWASAVVLGVLMPTGLLLATPDTLASLASGDRSKESPSSAISGIGVIEITAPPAACAPASAADTQIAIARERVESDVTAVAAARARLVREHLRLVEGPAALLHADFYEQDLQAQRNELQGARRELSRLEQAADAASCNPAPADSSGAASSGGAITEVRVELPVRLLQPLERALVRDTDLFVVYAERAAGQRSPVTFGRLSSVESRPAEDPQDPPIVVARARLDDSSLSLRQGEIVSVNVQLGCGADDDLSCR